jgi:S1-C subfamily serine protease
MNESLTRYMQIWPPRFQRARAFIRRLLPFATGVAAAFLALLLYSAVVPAPHQLNQNDVDNSIAQAMASATPPPAFSAQVYRVILPSVVLVESHATGGNGQIAGDGSGSGVIVNDNGDILTSLHVVADASYLYVKFADGTESRAEVVTTQPEHDIAVIRALQPPTLIVPATLGNPNAMRIGDEAFVVGNPFSLYASMSAGVISGLKRTFQIPNSEQTLEGLIQIDAAVNPGNSGGPLVNRYGQVVGIITALLNPTKQDVFIGIGFAVPIDVAGGAAGSPPV